MYFFHLHPWKRKSECIIWENTDWLSVVKACSIIFSEEVICSELLEWCTKRVIGYGVGTTSQITLCSCVSIVVICVFMLSAMYTYLTWSIEHTWAHSTSNIITCVSCMREFGIRLTVTGPSLYPNLCYKRRANY